MKLAASGFLIVFISGVNVIMALIPEFPNTGIMLANGLFMMIGMATLAYGLVTREDLPLPILPVATPAPVLENRGDAAVLSFLSLLQQKGRFVDFVMDDVSHYNDAQVGAAARVVHQGCNKVVREYFDLVPVQEAEEGSPVTVVPEKDEKRFRLVGKISGEPPYTGTLIHRGWRTTRIDLPHSLPQAIRNDVVAPAEIELS
jgi:hypothetical protein